MKKNSWIFLTVFFFALVFFRAMTFVYVGGDDATSVAYHVLGDDAYTQSYSPMAGQILSWLPENEAILRYTILLITNLALVLFVTLLLSIVFSWVTLPKHLPKWVVALVFFLAIPDLSYIGLVYSPILIAMTFVLGAHLVVRKSYRERWLFGRWTSSALALYLVAALLFGAGASFDLHALFYGVLIFGDLVLLLKKYRNIRLVDFFSASAWLWVATAFSATLVFVLMSGCQLFFCIEQLQAKEIVFLADFNFSDVASMLWLSLPLLAKLTPAFVLVSALGFFSLVRRRNLLWGLALLSFVSALLELLLGNSEFGIFSLPALALLFVVGFGVLWRWLLERKRGQSVGIFILGILLILPWIVGIQVSSPATAWGPGFSLKSYDYISVTEPSWAFVLDKGTALPSPKGPRPLGGHAYVLFGGGWRDFVSDDAALRADVLQLALDEELPLVVTSWSPDFYLNLLYEKGFHTKSLTWDNNTESFFALRNFQDGRGGSVNVFFAEVSDGNVYELLKGLREISLQADEALLVGDSLTLHALYENVPDVLTVVGTKAARVDLTALFSETEEVAKISEPSPMASAFTIISPKPIDVFLSNPGIGWQYDPNPESGVLPETVAYSRRSKIGWSILNPAEGRYRWEALDAQLEAAVAAGKQYSFRVFTMRGEEFGGHMLPEWVLEDGASLLLSGEPNYSSCVYQKHWATFVEALIERYDGNDDIAFVDISGYGNFNEWSWRDDQTQWSERWEQQYSEGTADAMSFTDIDSQARRRLVDMFIGGSFNGHKCVNENGDVEEISYEYAGFQDMQLVMPFAGIVQSTQYVFSRNPSVGFRYDCLGRSSASSIYERLAYELEGIWQQAPVVYELCSPEQTEWESALWMLENTHGALVHNNESYFSADELETLVSKAGYRYLLSEARVQESARAGEKLSIEMDWQNVGIAPSYPKMGQSFALMLYLTDENGYLVNSFPTNVDIAAWMPALNSADSAPMHSLSVELPLPATMQIGTYLLKVGIMDKRTGKPIQLAFEGNDGSGKYFLSQFEIID